MGRQLVVAVGDGSQLALHRFLVKRVEVHFLVLLAVDVYSNSSS